MTQPNLNPLVRIRFLHADTLEKAKQVTEHPEDIRRAVWHTCSLYPVELRPLELGIPHPDWWPCPNCNKRLIRPEELSYNFVVVQVGKTLNDGDGMLPERKTR